MPVCSSGAREGGWGGGLLAKQNKCLEQTLDNKKKVRVSVCLQFVVFSLSEIWWEQHNQESPVSPTWPDRLKVKSSRWPELINPQPPPSPRWKYNACPPVPLSCLPGIQQLKQVSSEFKVGSARAAVLWPFSMFCFSLMLMTVEPRRPPASLRLSSHTALVYTSTQQKHNISWVGDKDTQRRRQWGEAHFRAV